MKFSEAIRIVEAAIDDYGMPPNIINVSTDMYKILNKGIFHAAGSPLVMAGGRISKVEIFGAELVSRPNLEFDEVICA